MLWSAQSGKSIASHLRQLRSRSKWASNALPKFEYQVVLNLFVLFLGAATLRSGLKARRVIRQRDAARSPRRRKKLYRPHQYIGTIAFYEQSIFTLLIALSYFVGGWSPASVGLETRVHPLIAMAVGVVAYATLYVGLNLALRVAGTLEKMQDFNFRAHAMIWPRSKPQRICLLIAVLIFNPVLEEFMYRGILVHQLGELTGLVWLAIAVGFLVNLGNHVYQGRWAMVTHVPFYFIVVGLLYSPVGLWGAIGLHFAGDWVPILTMRWQMRGYRERHRRTGEVADRSLADSPVTNGWSPAALIRRHELL